MERVAPCKRWCTDASFEWVHEYTAACAKSAASDAARVTTEQIIAKAKAETSRSSAPKRVAPSTTEDAPAKSKTVSKKKKTAATPPAANAAAPAAKAAVATTSLTQAQTERAAADDALLQLHGLKPGLKPGDKPRKPCYFWFTNGSCKFPTPDGLQCRFHHG